MTIEIEDADAVQRIQKENEIEARFGHALLQASVVCGCQPESRHAVRV